MFGFNQFLDKYINLRMADDFTSTQFMRIHSDTYRPSIANRNEHPFINHNKRPLSKKPLSLNYEK